VAYWLLVSIIVMMGLVSKALLVPLNISKFVSTKKVFSLAMSGHKYSEEL